MARTGPNLASLESLYRETFRMAKGVAEQGDRLDAELLASSMVGMWDQPLLGVDDPVEFLGRGFVAWLESRRTADALALLTGLSSVAAPGLATMAAAAARRLRGTRIARPAWVDGVAPSRVTSAWSSSDGYGDQDMLVAVLEREGGPPAAIVTLIEHNLDGVAETIDVVPDPDGVRRSWLESAGLPVVELSVQAWVDRMTHGLDLAEETGHRTFEDGDPDCRALVRAKLRELPPARPLERADVSDEALDRLMEGFEASPFGQPLEAHLDLAFHILEYARSVGGDPLRWSPDALGRFLLDWLPRKVVMASDDLPRLVAVVEAWVRWAGERRGLSAELIEETCTALVEVARALPAAMADRSGWGPAKAIAHQMALDGVAIDDEAAVQAWIAAFNARPKAERDKVFDGIEELELPRD